MSILSYFLCCGRRKKQKVEIKLEIEIKVIKNPEIDDWIMKGLIESAKANDRPISEVFAEYQERLSAIKSKV